MSGFGHGHVTRREADRPVLATREWLARPADKPLKSQAPAAGPWLAMRTGMRTLATLLLASSLAACGGADYASGGEFGATPGGVKDMKLAREIIAAGLVPPADAILVEGMFAEHDLGLTGEECTRVLCLRSALGLAASHAGQERAWVQVGLSSAIDPDRWVRPPTTFVFTVDVSGSMSWGSEGSPGELSRQLMRALVPELRPDDRVAIVTYGSEVNVPLDLVSGTQQGTVLAAIDELSEAGSTNMEAGLERAYAIGREAVADGLTDDVRIVLFTDVQPNVGATQGSEFERMVEAGAEEQVSLTVLALGAGIGPEVLKSMAHVRGANAFSLFTAEDVETFMADEYPWFVTPVAFDLRLSVTPGEGFAVDEKFGFPAGDAPVGLEVASVFLSRRKGALLFNLEDVAGQVDFAGLNVDLRFDYTDRLGQPIRATSAVRYAGEPRDERGQYFQQLSTARTVRLALVVSAMHAAAERYATDHAAAVAILEKAQQRFAAEAAGDETLVAEVALAAELLRLMKADAVQDTLYGR
jgi:Ca-activated chloride channel family protein